MDPSGLMQVVTGKYWILPGFHTPDTAMFFNGVRKVVRGMIDQVDEIIPGAPDFGKQVERLEKMATKVGAHVQGQWRAFIQVYDCNDKNNDNIIDVNDELVGDSYWIEVTGIGSGGTKSPTPYDPTGGWKGDHYDTAGDAMDAAGTAIGWAFKTWVNYERNKDGEIIKVLKRN